MRQTCPAPAARDYRKNRSLKISLINKSLLILLYLKSPWYNKSKGRLKYIQEGYVWRESTSL